MYTKNYPATELSNASHQKNYAVAVEDTIELFVNKLPIAAILATPEMLKELAIGYLICEGVVKTQDEIKVLRIDGKIIHAEIEPTQHLELWRELRSSGCVGVRWDENEAISVRSDAIFGQDTIKKSLVFLESEIYKKTRGTHAACLVNTRGECVIKAIDVGRHNAFDKVAGRAILEGINLSEHFLLSTGRQPAGMVMKAARAGIPLVATKTAPLNTGIEAAQRAGVCLVCFVSRDKISVFTHPERLR
ncbi:MAG: formate dehydrogenase accessory sulfurtransferase FdhD [Euryarchaeota archaeon]|nr:formate dehydrogenase accessory sulfurtransferase FdhD [Euryarchaeota archaeon]MCG2728194.1 formate dehydrogenase accessory sulfurtransferase FdhD [Candidatus Methanoperedenaceae archaeon]